MNLAVHHTAVTRTSNQRRGVNNYHRDKWGMKSSLGWYIGYNWFVDADGTITHTRVDDEETIANVGHNCDVPERCDTISICFALNGDTQRFNKMQEKAFLELREQYSDRTVTLHRSIQKNRSCPGVLITKEYLEGLTSDDPDNGAEKQEEIKKLQGMIQGLLRQIIKLLQQKLSTIKVGQNY